MEKISPTPYPEVNSVLDLLLVQVKEILQGQFVGMYLFGSLANGDFDQYSDIDVLIVTEHTISDETFDALYKIHEWISTKDSPWTIQLEVSYIPRDSLYLFDPSNNQHPHIDRGPGETLRIAKHDAGWIIQRYILRKRGITITGPDPRTLIAPVSLVTLRLAVLCILQNWIRHFLDHPDELKGRGYQSYTVLTLCRILFTLEQGDIVSKHAAAEWAKHNLNEKWTALIERAWTGRQTPGLDAGPEDIDGTLNFIRYAMEYGSWHHDNPNAALLHNIKDERSIVAH
ncbi:MAG: aminoglycoside adenylyltransferase domain-containing protein [Bacteroidota bacterium]